MASLWGEESPLPSIWPELNTVEVGSVHLLVRGEVVLTPGTLKYDTCGQCAERHLLIGVPTGDAMWRGFPGSCTGDVTALLT